MMNRRDFMKLSAASAVTMGAVAGMAPASFAENAGVHTDAEVQAMVAEELRLSREVAFYPAAFRGDFDKFYVLFHKLSRAQYEKVDGAAVPGINASHYDMCVCPDQCPQGAAPDQGPQEHRLGNLGRSDGRGISAAHQLGKLLR